MKTLFTMAIIGILAGTAMAGIDDGPNSIGLYFEPTADTNSLAAVVNVPYSAYLVLSNPTYPDLSGFELSYTVVVPPGSENLYFRLDENLHGGLNVATGNTALIGEYVVGWPEPRIAEPTTVLATWQCMLLAPMSLEVYLGPTAAPSLNDGMPALEVGGLIISAGVSTGSPTIPVAVVNGSAPVAEDVTSFGGVKALFR